VPETEEWWNGGTVERWNGGTVERWNGGTQCATDADDRLVAPLDWRVLARFRMVSR
jgi:hypothetical protein